MSQRRQQQLLIRQYKRETGETQVDMRSVAEYAIAKGWPIPQPRSPIDRLARQFAAAARQETRYDRTTGKPYRANHAVEIGRSGQYQWVWVDIDEAQRSIMRKSLVHRREQMVDDGYQLTLDLEHWNRTHADEEPIELPMDLTLDIEWRKNTDEEDAA